MQQAGTVYGTFVIPSTLFHVSLLVTGPCSKMSFWHDGCFQWPHPLAVAFPRLWGVGGSHSCSLCTTCVASAPHWVCFPGGRGLTRPPHRSLSVLKCVHSSLSPEIFPHRSLTLSSDFLSKSESHSRCRRKLIFGRRDISRHLTECPFWGWLSCLLSSVKLGWGISGKINLLPILIVRFSPPPSPPTPPIVTDQSP